ncbi:hypothetical protein ZIOFF_033727 [Zingiber officinale]|uniref:RING-type E3 ubiquitin transferase n=2 Tax=Zingiber officinale TaxID=94328 RepID=A0A8J5GQU2_ZINOF|nr:hypothetical protein ZIOFF_033727 [Zingiber officinale]
MSTSNPVAHSREIDRQFQYPPSVSLRPFAIFVSFPLPGNRSDPRLRLPREGKGDGTALSSGSHRPVPVAGGLDLADMGNSLGCSASGERLVSAARDGDLVEARMLLEFNPGLAKYSTFRGLNSPLHFAAAKGHSEVGLSALSPSFEIRFLPALCMTLWIWGVFADRHAAAGEWGRRESEKLLWPALMQACRHGHWEVVQTLLIFRSIVTRVDYLNGRSALHFAAVGGHVRCIRLLVADFIPSAPYDIIAADKDSTGSPERSSDQKYDRSALMKFINKPADGGITALHMASLNGYIDCVQLLLDLGANVSAVTFNYGSSSNLIGAGSTPLHYAACGGNLKCSQAMLKFSLLERAIDNRECGLQPSVISDNYDLCAVCLERTCSVAAEGSLHCGCGHELCVQCALYLCSTSSTLSAIAGPPGSIPCPLCRNGIVSFVKLPSTPAKGLKPNLALTLCSPCILTPRSVDNSNSSRVEARRNRTASSELVCPLICTPFSGFIPSNYDDEPCSTSEPQVEAQPQSARSTLATFSELEKIDEQRADSSCSAACWCLGDASEARESQFGVLFVASSAAVTVLVIWVRVMGVGVSSVVRLEGEAGGIPTGLGDLPENCVAAVLAYLEPLEICRAARLSRTFRGAASADLVWETKLPRNHRNLLALVSDEKNPYKKSRLCKKEIYARLCRPVPFDGGTKEFWLERISGGICMAISSRALLITGIDDRRYWNYLTTEESRFHSVAYLHQTWWFEVDGEIKFCFPAGSYSLFFRLHLGRATKRLGRRICITEHIHGWDIEPVRFQMATSDGQFARSKCCLDKIGSWILYHAGDFVVNNSDVPTNLKFSMKQIDCTHTKGGLCVDSVFIYPTGFREGKVFATDLMT